MGGKPRGAGQAPHALGRARGLTQVDLKQGERYAIQFETESGVSQPPGMVWKRVSRDPLADLRAGAAKADVLVAVVGLTSDLEGEEMPVKVEGFSGGDRTTIDLPRDQREYLAEAAKLGKPLVVINLSGSAIDLSWAKANAAAIVQAWYPGEGGGPAIAQVLAGAANPAGRLPVTFYKGVADLPPFDDYNMQGPHLPLLQGRAGVRLRLWPQLLQLPLRGAQAGAAGEGRDETRLVVRTAITNTSSRDGDEVAQLTSRRRALKAPAPGAAGLRAPAPQGR